nr:CO(2)-response secreted protease-like isoform X1 [Ziziphus jujuba var. spinosa]
MDCRMKGIWMLLSLVCFLFLVSSLGETKAAYPTANNGLYIVYMGAAASSNGSLRIQHAQLLRSVLRGKPNAVVHTYKNGFSGFAARLSEAEANSIAKNPGVVSVFPDPLLKLHTTHSWDFLKYQTALKVDSNPNSDSNSSISQGSDTIIGILDTGIWPESESFTDKGMGPVPSRWKGKCMEAADFTSSNCNRKLIGARFYNQEENKAVHQNSARDAIGHGTHVASTAGGSTVEGASYYGLAEGTAKGGSPASRIAMYRVCSDVGCRGSAILAAFDDAIADGVDVLSLSLGAPAMAEPDFSSDPIALGAFHAVERGILVVCSAGNDGPTQGTVSNVAPWIFTVAASTMDRDFESDVVFGSNNKVIKGEGINFSPLKNSAEYPLIHAKATKTSDGDEDEASSLDMSRNCDEIQMDKDKVKGKIVICDSDDGYRPYDKRDAVKNMGGIGAVIIDTLTRSVAENFGGFPTTVISSKDAQDILSYWNSTSKPVATILPTVAITKYKPAPVIAYFSSRGPAFTTNKIIKPDIAAPGVNILAAWIGNDTEEAPEGKQPSPFNVISGTSMSCPHVSGIAATVKSQYPTWSPSAIRSAIMTSATHTNNLGAPITTDSGSIATPHDYGAGEVTTQGPLQPGLVYETSTIDYLYFLCYSRYELSDIKKLSNTIPSNFTCPKEWSDDAISNINYPSIAISNFDGKQSKNVTRTVTNVSGDEKAVFMATMDAPSGLDVKVIPDKLAFTKNNQKLSYQVVFSSAVSPINSHVYGSITWTNGKFSARSPFVVSK